MKFIKENWFVLIITVLFSVLYFISVKIETGNQNTIKKIESEKTEIKKKAEIEIKKLNEIIETQKAIATSKDFEIVKRDKVIDKLSGKPKAIIKTKIRYKDRIVYKTSPQSELYDFSENVTFDFWKYVKEAEKKNVVTKKIILDLKLINTKSEQQIQYILKEANGWNWTYGVGGSVGTRGADISLNVSYSKRLRRLKIK